MSEPLRPPPPDDADDRALLARIASGDGLAFETFHRRYAGLVYRFVRAHVRDAEIAEEVTVDALVSVWRTAGRFAGRARVRTWLLGIAHHKAIDALRRRRAATLPLDDLRDVAADDDGPEAAAIAAASIEALQRAIETLTPEHRIVLELAYLHDLSVREIAEIVDVPIATVKTRAFYARRRLRAALETAG